MIDSNAPSNSSPKDNEKGLCRVPAMKKLKIENLLFDHLPEFAQVAAICQDPERKQKILSCLDYLAESPDAENVSLLPPTVAVLAFAIGGGAVADFMKIGFPWVGLALSAVLVALFVCFLVLSRKMTRTTKISAWAKSWRSAIREYEHEDS